MFSYPTPSKETARKELERCQKKLSIYNDAVSALTQDLLKLQQQWEVAEDRIIITLAKELQNYPTKKEREAYIYQVIGAKEEVERSIEKTILTINHLTDSIVTAQQKMQEANAVISEKQLLLNQYGKIPNPSDD